jgi:tRNA(Ile)-lysidine synthase
VLPADIALFERHLRDERAVSAHTRAAYGRDVGDFAAFLSREFLEKPEAQISAAEIDVLAVRSYLAHLRARGLDWREDPSNADPAYRRNRVRHELLPYLTAHFNPRAAAAIARAASLLADEAAFVRREARALLAAASREGNGRLVLRREALARAPLPVARAAVREALRRTGGLRRVGAVHVERVVAIARGTAPAGREVALPGARTARFTSHEIRLEKRSPTG